MNTQPIGYKTKAFEVRKLAFLFLVIVLLLSACTQQPQPARIEEITFQSGEFTIVGDLRTPAGTGPFPVILFVHGSGPVDRTFFGGYLPIMEQMLGAGYAVFSWDKPGTGQSTGQVDDSTPRKYHKRAQIVLDAIEVVKTRCDIDAGHIGLWGISQASHVMPLALSMSEDIAFMICVSCTGMSGLDQGMYLDTMQSICAGVPDEQADELKRLLSEFDRARTYETYAGYVHYRETLAALAGIASVRPDNSSRGVIPEAAWRANDPEIEDWWNPIEVIEQTTIPVLAIFGDRDPNVDGIQGAFAWRKALERAGNPNFRVELLPGVGHIMEKSQTGCLEEQAQTFEQVMRGQGIESISEFQTIITSKEPGRQPPFSQWPYDPAFLDILEQWIKVLPR
jgi:pimeloyl-ACP methyl ester carboxylesterase